MKKVYLLGLLLFVSFVNAGIYANHECTDFRCIEDQTINFTVTVWNNIRFNVTVHDVYVKDYDDNKLLAMAFIDKIKLRLNESKELHLLAPIKMPANGRTWNYFPCMKVSATDFPGEVEIVCGDAIKDYTVIPLSDIECYSNDDCNVGICKFNRCKSEDSGLEVCNMMQIEKDGSCVTDFWLLGKIIVLALLLVGCFFLLKRWF